MHRLVIALVTLLGLVGAAVVASYLLLFSVGTDRAARLAPDESAVYVNVYLQPSAGQQMNLSELIGRLPGFADDASLDAKVDQVVQNLLAGSGIDYRRQIKPWLGDQVAIAAWPGDAGIAEAQPVLIAAVKDREAAEASAADFVGTSGATFTTQTHESVELHVSADAAYAFIDDMLVVGADALSLETVIDVSRGAGALADRDDFRRTMDEMTTDHLAAAFIDLAAIAREADADQQLSGVSTAGAVLVAEREGLRISGSAPFATGEVEASARAGFALGGEPSSLVDWMPADTIAEVVVFGLRQTLEDAEAAAAGTPEGEELSSALDTLRAVAAFGLGVDLDADVLPLLDREVGLALAGLEGELPSGQLLLRPADPAAAEDALARIVDRLAGVGATAGTEAVGDATVTVVTVPELGEVAYTVSDGTVILALGVEDVAAALESHDAGTSLGASDAYRRTFETAGVRAGNEAWADVRALVALLGGGAELDDDVRDILGQIGTFGFTAPSRDDRIEFHAVLTVEAARPD